MSEGRGGTSRSGVLVRGWLTGVAVRAWLVLAVVGLLAGGSLYHASRHLGVNTNAADLLDRELPFQQARARIESEFPGQANTLLLVVEAATPEQARQTAEEVYQRVLAMPEAFRQVDWSAGMDFFRDNGLLLRSDADLDRLTDQLSQAQPMLARLAADPTVPGLFGLLTEAAEHGDDHELDLDAAFAAVAGSLDAVVSGEDAMLSWQRLLAPDAGEANSSAPAREVLVVQPVLDFGRVMAGRDAMEAAQSLRRELGLDAGPVQLRITGSVALAYEELQSVLVGAQLAGLLALVLVSLAMYVGLRSLRLVVVALLSLLAGLSITLGFATVAIGHLNLISVAFTVLYVGLGVNYAIHFLLRYREGLADGLPRQSAITSAGDKLLGALALSAITTAIGFFAFVPTDYAGVAELGLIAGVAMAITFAISYTLLPALLALVPAPTNVHRDRSPVLPARLLDIPLHHRTTVRWAALTLTLIALALSTQLRFDSDPLNVRDPDSESVLALRSLLADKATGHRNLQVLIDSADQVPETVARLKALPTVDRAVSLLSFVPEDQDDKLARIDELRWLLGPDLLTATWTAQAAGVESTRAATDALIAALDPTAVGAASRRLLDSLGRFRQALQSTGNDSAAALNARAHQQLLALLPVTLGQLTRALRVDAPIAFDELPDDLRRRWLSPDGSWIVQVFPAGDLTDLAEQARFVEQVRTVRPQASGMPVIQLESGLAITAAFRQAMLWAVLGIGVVLVVLLRAVKLSVKVLVPLLLGGLLTAALMVGLDIPFNFANVIALPLLLGVGVDNGIHLVYRHRAGDLPEGNVLRSATARGIVFGALTTVLSFGNLAFSPHAGTASLGLVLAAGLTLMVLATLVVLPALLKR